MRLSRRHAALALVAGLGCVAWGTALPQSQALGLVRESAVKAAFLYKFGSFVEWPASRFRTPGGRFLIGVYDDDAVAAELEQLTAGRSVNGRPVAVVRVRDADDIAGLHIFYAGGPRESRVRDLLASARGAVLTVADRPLAGRAAPVLYFTQDEGRLRFAASLTAAAARDLKLSSRLLAVAQLVEGR